MTASQLNTIRTWFTDYAHDFVKTETGKFGFILGLKFDHCRRVADECRWLATEIGWSHAASLAAEALGLIHDTGRFSQYREYGTLSDPGSVDHGERGSQIVQGAGILAGSEYESEILAGIRYHNLRDVPQDLCASHADFVSLIRDADKLDILKVFNDAVKLRTYIEHPELLPGVDPDGPISPDLIHEISTTHQGSYVNVRSLLDIQLMKVTWLYSFTHDVALRELVDRHLLDDIRDVLPDTPDVNRIISEADAYLTTRLKRGATERP